MPDTTADDFCPSCGEWKRTDPFTGWCNACVVEFIPDMKICATCDTPFDTYGGYSNTCQRCKREAFLTNNADRLEELMIMGLPLYKAMAQVRKEKRPLCIVCGKVIRGGDKDAKMCGDHPEVRKIYDRRRQRLVRKGEFTRERALRETLEEFYGNATTRETEAA